MEQVVHLFIKIVIIGLLLLGCDNKRIFMQDDKPITSGQEYYLNESDLNLYGNEALLGSAESAWKIYLYYSFYDFDKELSVYWLQIAAENGHVIGQYNLAVRFMDEFQYNRARFWAKKAISNGDKKAVNLLKIIDEREHKNK